MVFSPDGNSDFSDIVAWVLLGDISALFLYKIYLDYVLRTSTNLVKGKYFYINKTRNKRFLREIITRVVYADDLALPAQIESLLCSLEKVERRIRLYVN